MCSCDGISSVFQARTDQVKTQVGIAVLAKSLEATQTEGRAAVELLQAATDLAQQIGKGLQFDARA